MTSNWKTFRIDEICTTVSDTYKGNDSFVVLINTSDVYDGLILNHKKVDNSDLPGQFKKTFKKDDILYSEIRPANRRFAFVDFDDTNYYIASTKLMVIRANTNVVLPRFLFYLITTNSILTKLQHLAETRSGTFPQITFKSELAPLEVKIPPLDVQKNIVLLLESIDNKITNNLAINRKLLETAMLNYSIIFAGKNKNGTIGDYCKMKSGFAFKGTWWTDRGAKVVKIGDINQDELNLDNCSYVAEDKIRFARDFILVKGDVVIAMTGATIGKFAIVPESDCILLANQRVGKFFLGEEPINSMPFLYCTLAQPDIYKEIINKGQGSAQPNFSGKDIESIACFIPEKETIKSFNSLNQNLFEQYLMLQKENKKFRIIKEMIADKYLGEVS